MFATGQQRTSALLNSISPLHPWVLSRFQRRERVMEPKEFTTQFLTSPRPLVKSEPAAVCRGDARNSKRSEPLLLRKRCAHKKHMETRDAYNLETTREARRPDRTQRST